MRTTVLPDHPFSNASYSLRTLVRTIAAGAFCAGLGGCINVDVAGKSARPAIAQFDLSGAASESVRGLTLSLGAIDVGAPTWLDSTAMQYRLAHVDPLRRASYADSRWVAPPPELLRQTLRRALTADVTQAAGPGCRLQVDIEEFIQRFDGLQTSSGVVELRANLLAPRGDKLLAGRRFRASSGAATADARGGVAALSMATAEVTAGIRDWLVALEADASAGQSIAARCKGI